MTLVRSVPAAEHATADARRWRGVGVVLVMLAAVAVVRALVVMPVTVESSSMLPTLRPGDVVLITSTPPSLEELDRGDLIVFRSPDDGRRAIKRVVGLPGDRLVVLDGQLYVDGRAVTEPWVDTASVDGYYSQTFEVPAGTVFVFGDNRGNSVDSRDYGPVSGADLLGRALLRLWHP